MPVSVRRHVRRRAVVHVTRRLAPAAEAEAQALKVRDEAEVSAWKAYNEAVAPAQKAYDEAVQRAR